MSLSNVSANLSVNMPASDAGSALPRPRRREREARRDPLVWTLGTIIAAGIAVAVIAVVLRATVQAGVRPAATAGAPVAVPDTVDATVWISGRDDHGLLYDAHVALYQAPAASPVVGQAHDGTLARVLAHQGTWLRVRTIEPRPVEGWVDDYYLRDRALRTDGGGQVTFAGAETRDGSVWVAVRPIGDSQAAPQWLPAAQLKEVGARER